VKNEKHIVSVSEDDLRPGRTDWKRLDALTDEDIERAIAEDPDAAPPLDAEWFRNAELVIPAAKVATSIRVDGDVMDWFRTQGRGWQTRMNAVLRAYAKAHGGVK
jgi:uncharacterized protein (DUF4415 family)